MRYAWLRGVPLVIAATLSSACGYALAGRGSFLPAHIRVVAVPPVENGTPVAGFEQILTERIREAFINRGRYDVRSDTEGAHAVLRAQVLSITRTAAGLNEQQLASRYLLTVTMRVSFEDLTDGSVLWQNESLSISEESELSGTLDGGVVDQQRASWERIADSVARSVVTAILEAF